MQAAIAASVQRVGLNTFTLPEVYILNIRTSPTRQNHGVAHNLIHISMTKQQAEEVFQAFYNALVVPERED